MCFSKEASYVTGTILVAMGAYTTLSNKQKKLLPAACIPLFFGIQQLSEGNLWSLLEQGFPVKLTSLEHMGNMGSISAAIFLLFAFLIWPIWIPLSTYLPEKNPARKKLLGCLLLNGIFVAAVAVLSLKNNALTIKVVEHSIQYVPQDHMLLPLNLFLTLYGLSAIVPSFISTTRGFSVFGITSLSTLIIAYYFYFNTMTSVWCFFSAWLSILIALIIRAGNEEAETTAKEIIKR